MICAKSGQLFLCPPRYFEGVLTNVMIRMEDAGKLKQALFRHFMDHAQKVGGALLDGQPVSSFDRLKYGLGRFWFTGRY